MAQSDRCSRQLAEQAGTAYEARTPSVKDESSAAADLEEARLQRLQRIKALSQSYEPYFGPRPRPSPEQSDTAVRDIQSLVDLYVPREVSLVDELVADRRAEVEREPGG